MGILETYGVKWSLEKTARDVLQNFYDYKKSLENVRFEVKKSGGDYVVRITNGAEYDRRMLLHLGATDKTGEDAGGFGEGAKILALVLLRDYGFKSVKYASNDWQIEFQLSELPKDEYPKPIRGLFAHITEAKSRLKGNYIELVTPDHAAAQAFSKARELFYHPDNLDFKDPTLDMPGIGGFKLISSDKESKNGNLYAAGQRTHFQEETWQTVEHVNIWLSRSDILPKDRDRGRVTRTELNKAVDYLVENIPQEMLEKVLFSLKPIWERADFFDVGYKMMRKTAERLIESGAKCTFSDEYLANDLPLDYSIQKSLSEAGYKLVPKFFAELGMKTASQRYKELQSHYRVEITETEAQRLEVLKGAAALLGKGQKEIWVYDAKDEKNIIQGQYDGDFVWLSRQTLGKPFNEALATYVHELDHKHGTDQSATFSYALTDSIAVIVSTIMNKQQDFANLNQRWAGLSAPRE